MIVINQLKQNLTELTNKLGQQIQKNVVLEKVAQQLRIEMDLMTTKMSDLAQELH